MNKRVEERPFECSGRVRAMGRTTVTTTCPFCGVTLVIFVWSFHGTGKKACECGAMLHRDGVARKLVEAAP